MATGRSPGMSSKARAASGPRDVLDLLRRWIWIPPLAMLITTTVGVWMAARQPTVYQAQGALVVAGGDVARQVATEVLILRGEAVRQRVLEAVPGARGVTVRSASPTGTGDLVDVFVEDNSPTRAAATVDAYVVAYLDYKRDEALTSLLRDSEKTRRSIAELDIEVARLTTEYEAAVAEIVRRTAVAPGAIPTVVAARAQERNRAQRELDSGVKARRDTLLSEQLALESDLRELEADHDLTNPGGAQEVNRTRVPTTPLRPKPLKQGLEGAAHGLAVGVALAFAFDRLDESIRSRPDAERILGPGTVILATIPLVTEWKMRSDPLVVTRSAPRSPAAEAYRTLRTSVQFAGVDRRIDALAVASPSAGEGKTTTAVNLAVVVAATGRRVVLVDGDLRRPRAHTFFGMSNDIGLSSWMIGDAPLTAALRPVPGVQGLSLLAAGPIPPNPSELLSSARFPELIRTLGAGGTLVIVDTAPILMATDVTLASRTLDAVLVVTLLGRGTKKHLVRALELLDRPNAPYVGVVLNGASTQERPHRHAYEDEAPPRRGGGRGRGAGKGGPAPTPTGSGGLVRPTR